MARFSKVFISSTSKDLREYRDEVYKLISNRLGLTAVAMEDFGAMSDEPSEACLDKVQECDLFIGFYARRYGFIPEDSGGVSITEMEYDKARQEGKTILCYWLEDNFDWPEERNQPEHEELLYKFKDKIQKKHVVETFSTPSDLCLKISTAIAREQNKQEDTLADFDLPPNIDLPSEPYLGLHYFKREHARIFFGRNADIRELYVALEAFNVILLSGQSGCGKSSLLAAGLIPRMEKRNWQCIYLRMTEGDVLWQVKSELQSLEPGNRCLVIFDQVEELFLNDSPDNDLKCKSLLELLISKSSEQVKFILSFRKEFLLEVKKLLQATRLDFDEVLLSNLNRTGIIEAVRGITSSALTRRYKVEFEQGLPEEIAGDIINDRESNVAPLLQILLRKMYDSCMVGSNGKRFFSQNLYYQFKTTSLEEMLDTQLGELGKHFPEEQKSGLDLDILYRLTTDHGSNSLPEQEVRDIYCHLPIVEDMINELISLFLVIRIAKDNQEDKMLRLAHDSLASFIRKKHQNSEASGPMAHKILTNRHKEIATGQFVELTRNDLDTIEKGRNGMRCLSDAEEQLIQENHHRLLEREQELEEKNKRLEQQNLQLQEANRRMEEMTRMVVKGLSKGLVNAARLSYEMKNYSRAFRLAEQALRIQRDSIEAKNLLIQVYNHIPFLSDLTGFLGEFRNFYYAADGSLFLTVYADNTAAVWDSKGKILSKLEGHTAGIICAHFAPGNNHVATGSMDGTARLWKINDGSCEQVFSNNEPVLQAEVSLNGNILVVAGSSWKVWNAQGGLLLEKRAENNSWIVSAEFSADGRKVLVATSSRLARIWEIETQNAVDLDIGESNKIVSAVFAPSGYLVAIAYSTGQGLHRIALWSIDGKLLVETSCVETGSSGKEFAFAVSKLSFSPDNRYILAISKYHPPLVVIWNLKGQRIRSFGKEHEQEIVSLSCSDDAQRVMTASLDGTIKVWTLPEGKLLIDHIAHQQGIQTATFMRGSHKIISVGHDQSVFIWPGKQAMPNILTRHHRTIFSAAYSPDGKKILTTSRDGTVAIWDTEGNLLRRIDVNPPDNRDSGVFRAVFSPDGFRIVTSGLDNYVKIWNFHGDLIATLHGHTASVYEATFSEDGEYILTSSADHTVRVWNSDGIMLKVLEGHTDKVYSASFSKDSKIVLSASNDGEVIIWRDWQHSPQPMSIGKNQVSKPISIFRAVFSPDEKLILCACKDGAVRIWDTYGTLHKTIQAHEHGFEVFWAEFSPDGRRIVTASADKLVKLFNFEDGQLMASLQGHTREVTCAIFSPDGQKVLSTSSDRTIKIWEANPEQIVRSANEQGVGFLHRHDLMDFEIAMAHSSVNIDNVQEMLANGAYLPNLYQYAMYYRELAKRSSNNSSVWLEKAKTLYGYLQEKIGLKMFDEALEQINKPISE